jgi:hypothetical protein
MTGTTRRDFLIAVAGTVNIKKNMFGVPPSGGALGGRKRPAEAGTPNKHVDLAGIRTRAEWQAAREKILANMRLVMGELPKKKTPAKIIKLESEESPNYICLKIKYLAEADDYVPAYLLTPKNLKRRAPAMLCLHQTIRIGKDEPVGLGGNPNLHYAKELTKRGYICIAPDYPYLGENSFDPYKGDGHKLRLQFVQEILRRRPDWMERRSLHAADR